MAAGDFYIRRNNADTSVINNAGGANEDSGWDTLVYDEGSIVTYSDPNFQLDIGIYLIMYSEYFSTTDTTNNERIEIQGEIHQSGVGVIGGYGQDYIRKSSGDQACVVQGYTIVEVAANNTDYFIRFYRTDNSTTGTVNRVVGRGGVTILQLDNNDNFGLYSTNSSEATSGTTVRTLVANTNDRQDTGFSNSSGIVTITTAGRYLATYTMDVSQTATGREIVSAFIEKNSTTEVIGTRGYCYLRGADGTQDGAVTWIGIIDVAASDTLRVRWSCPTSATITAAAGAQFQLWQIPSGGDEFIAEATTGDYNADADFAWDTNPHIDTASFTHTAGTSDVTLDQNDHVLAFATFAQVTDSTVQRAVPLISFENAGAFQNYAAGGGYHRNSATSNFSCGIAGLIHGVESGLAVNVHTEPDAAAGSLANTKGQFSLLSLSSLYTYTFSFPPAVTDVDTDEVITNSQANVVITGRNFEATQGTGKVELVQNSNYSGTIVNQTSIDSWSDTSIQIDVAAGALADTNCFLFVTNNSGDRGFIALQVGLPPETYQEALEALTPAFQHYWTFQNTYADEVGTATANNSSGGTPTFSTTPIVKGDTHSLLLNQTTEYISPADQSDMNTSSTASRRMMAGWIMLDSIVQTVSVIWEEGAQVNNYAWLIGFGNSLMIQFADDGGDYVQIYFPVTLTPDRPYHVYMEFNASGQNSGICRGLLDGVENVLSNGNPWEVATFPSHSGNISWGHEGTENLQVGDSRGVDNVDIAFATPVSCHYAHFISLENNEYTDTQIREEMFEKGAIATTTIAGGTESAMQTSIDAEADTLFTDAPCGLEIGVCTAGDFELTLDNITFEDRVSMQIRYMGVDTLTLVTENGTVLDTNKLGTPYGGTITVVNAVPVTLTVQDFSSVDIVGARVLMKAATGGPLPFEDSITITRSGSTATATHTAHGMLTGQQVLITGANQAEYNGIKTITVTTANAYTYTVSGTPTTPATGTIICTAVIISGVTDVNGEVTTNLRYSSSQPIDGIARKGSSGSLFKNTPFSGTIGSTGLSQTVFMLSDE